MNKKTPETNDIAASSSIKDEYSPTSEQFTAHKPDINLVDLMIALGNQKNILISITLLAAIVGIVISLSTPSTYVARTSIMPVQQSSGGASLSNIGALSGLAGLAGLGGLSSIAGGIKSSDEMYIAFMRSRSVQESLIEQFKLKERYGAKTLEDTRQTLTQNVTITADKKSGLLLIDAQDGDAEFAASLANAQVKALNTILSRLAVTEAQQRRVYYEQQVVKTQTKIPQLETEFKALQKDSGVEVAGLLSESGTLPSQIAAKELQVQILSRFATYQNPELKRLQNEIAALRSQLAKYDLSKSEFKPNEQRKSEVNANNNKSFLLQKATQAYTTLKIQESLLDGYVKQLELAKLDEAKEGPVLQVLDVAKAPEIRAKPERRKIVVAYTVTGFSLAFMIAVIKAILVHVNASHEGKTRWRQLKRAWGFK